MACGKAMNRDGDPVISICRAPTPTTTTARSASVRASQTHHNCPGAVLVRTHIHTGPRRYASVVPRCALIAYVTAIAGCSAAALHRTPCGDRATPYDGTTPPHDTS